MLVNSISFWIFFIAILVPYWLVAVRQSAKWQNAILLIGSYYFYAQASWKMCFLLAIATCVFYGLGILIEKQNQQNEKLASWLTNLGVYMGVGLLLYFKFLDFFIDEFAHLLNTIGLQTNMSSFGIIMPLGISFFTFKLISYVVEVHREHIPASRNIVDFGTFIAFFPAIMSGPIDRPNQFLPQLETTRPFSYEQVREGMKRILWGMFLKMCIADQLSGYTDTILMNYSYHNASSILLAMFLYAFQMYTDFCGYSDMALGVGQIMGIKIRENFNRPFWSQNVAEYWRRWHMSLTTWLTDYVFMPLNLSFRSMEEWGLYLATLLNLIIVGFWHGANWTYGLFGLYHGLLLVLVTATDKKRKKWEKQHQLKNNPWWKYSRQLLTFVLCTIGFLIFRSATCSDFFATIATLRNGFGHPFHSITLYYMFLPLLIMLFREYKDENKLNIHFLHSENVAIRVGSVIALITLILLFGNMEGGSFIYYKF